MDESYFWSIIKKYNSLMKEAISGPDCTDPEVCDGNCCSIKIDVPKVLAEKYIELGYANKNDFIRSNVFSFQLRFNEKTGKCFLFDKNMNGCSVHNSGIKPPQCWIYPTNFSNPETKEIKCKKVEGWIILDSIKAAEAEKLLKYYTFLCQLEIRRELKYIKERIGKDNKYYSKKKIDKLKNNIIKIPPSQISGFKDAWDCIIILSAEGLSLQMKKFCFSQNNECKFYPDNFLDCKTICNKIADRLIEYLNNNLYKFIKKEGLDQEGQYPFYKLFEFNNNFF